MQTLPTLHRVAFVAAAAVLLHACVDSPAAPDGAPGPHPFLIAPVLSLAGPDGAPARTAAQNQALNDAFKRVNRFRVEVRRTDGSLVLDTLVEVSPGQPEYDFQLGVEATPGETLSVSLTAFEGETELFRSPPVSVEAKTADAAGGAPPAPADITLSYSGPGATASSISLSPETLVLAPRTTASLTAQVLDGDGEALPDVPVTWTSSAPGVLEVDDGALTARSGGATRVTVTTPTGLEAEATVYVVGGTLAYVEGGVLKTRPAAGGTPSLQSGTDAGQPAWSADGSMLFYNAGGSVRRAPSNSALVDGSWPTVSPDGTKLAFERRGTVWLSNLDGSQAIQGPSGTTPVWTGARELVVAGGSIERVGVDGSGRTTVVSGEASFPAVGPSGAVAYVAGGALRVQGRAEPLASGVSGRPTWSPGGAWLAVASGEGIVVVPADGSGPPLPLPGLGAATHPAFQPLGSLAAHPALELTGLDPDPPLPGQPVRILGSGFDDVIPGNNRVFWPTRDGQVEVEVTEATPGALTTEVPAAPAEGNVRVATQNGEATLPFEPTLGVLEIRTITPWDTPVPDVPVGVADAAGEKVAEDRTDESGSLVVAGLEAGRYTVTVSVPEGFVLEGAATRSVEIATDLVELQLRLLPVPARVEVTPAEPTLSVGQTLAVTAKAFDVNGAPIERFSSSAWVAGALGRLSVRGSGTSGSIRGLVPSAARGDASFTIMLSGQVFSQGATVLTRITGTVTGAPAGGVSVELLSSGGALLARTTTNPGGSYTFDGLLQGSYRVRPIPPGEDPVFPSSAVVVIDDTHPVGHADFSIGAATGTRRPGDIVLVQDYMPWDGKDQAVLTGAPFNFTAGTDYVVTGSAFVTQPIPSTTSVVVLGSLSSGGGALSNVNSASGQANLDQWVRNGGWLLAHLADNVDAPGQGYMVPGLSGVADDVNQCPGLHPPDVDHPFIRGPDGLLGTSDDVTDASADNISGCYANHGSLSGILPPGATVLMYEDGGGQRPTYATYAHGAGRVVVSTQTLEWGSLSSGQSVRNVINHFWWTLMGGSPPAVVAPALRMLPDTGSPRGVLQDSDVPVPGGAPPGDH